MENDSPRWSRWRCFAFLWQGLCGGAVIGWSLSYWWPVGQGSAIVFFSTTCVLLAAGSIPLAFIEIAAGIQRYRIRDKERGREADTYRRQAEALRREREA